MTTTYSGQKFGVYVIGEKIGQGSFASVYRAHHDELGEEAVFAVKFIRPDLLDDHEVVQRFRREAMLLYRLTHPGIVRLYEFNRSGEVSYLVLDYVSGQTLEAALRAEEAAGRRLPVERALAIAAPLCQALDYAGRHNMVHRDIKPANILLREDGSPVITDFGLGRVLSTETSAKGAAGTFSYMAPEQLGEENPAVDHQSDVYSLGVVTYQLLAGQTPFGRQFFRCLTEPAPPLRPLNPAVSPDLEAAVLRSLERAKDRRYRTAGELAAALLAAAGGARGASPALAGPVAVLTPPVATGGLTRRAAAQTGAAPAGSTRRRDPDPQPTPFPDPLTLRIFHNDASRHESFSLAAHVPLAALMPTIIARFFAAPDSHPPGVTYQLFRREDIGRPLPASATLAELGLGAGVTLLLLPTDGSPGAPQPRQGESGRPAPHGALWSEVLGVEFRLHKPCTLVGRAVLAEQYVPDVDLSGLDNALASRRHAEILRRDAGYFLRPLRTTNGTLLNGQACAAGQEFPLHPDDEIQFGRGGITLKFRLVPTPAGSSKETSR